MDTSAGGRGPRAGTAVGTENSIVLSPGPAQAGAAAHASIILKICAHSLSTIVSYKLKRKPQQVPDNFGSASTAFAKAVLSPSSPVTAATGVAASRGVDRTGSRAAQERQTVPLGTDQKARYHDGARTLWSRHDPHSPVACQLIPWGRASHFGGVASGESRGVS